jgi:hypothetical protein
VEHIISTLVIQIIFFIAIEIHKHEKLATLDVKIKGLLIKKNFKINRIESKLANCKIVGDKYRNKKINIRKAI